MFSWSDLIFTTGIGGWSDYSQRRDGETEAQRATSLLRGGGAGLAELVCYTREQSQSLPGLEGSHTGPSLPLCVDGVQAWPPTPARSCVTVRTSV